MRKISTQSILLVLKLQELQKNKIENWSFTIRQIHESDDGAGNSRPVATHAPAAEVGA